MRRRSLLAAGASLLAAPSIARAAGAGTLRIVPQAALSSLDPIWTTASVTQGHGYAVFDTLYSLDGKLKPQPQMAEGHDLSSDGLVWTIRLRSGLKFHDNEPVRAADCIASLQRWSKRDAVGQNLARLVVAWEVVDDRTFRVRLNRAFAPFLAALAKPASVVPFIMPERLAKTDANTQITEMVGSGPFRFLKDEFVSGSRVAYAKFDGYVPRDEPVDFMAGGRRVYFDRIEWQVIPDPSTAASALLKKEVDWIEFALPDLLPLYKGNAGVKVAELDDLGFIGIMRFNALNPPFDKPAVRHAVMAAVDQSDYMRAVNGDNIRWKRCAAMFPCGLPFVKEDAAGVLNRPRDIEGMRADIKAAGYAGERVVVINPTDFPSIAPFGDVTADLLQQLGMNVDLQAMDWGTVGTRRTSKASIGAGGWSIFHTWTANVSVTNPALNYYLRGQGETGWFGWYKDAEIERLTDQWTQASTDAEQQVLFDAVQKEAIATAPFVPLGQYYPVTAYRSDITDRIPATNALFWNVRRA